MARIEIKGRCYDLQEPGADLSKLFGLACQCITGSPGSLHAFEQAAEHYFDEYAADASAQDRYFTAFTPLWSLFRQEKNYQAEQHIWSLVLQSVLRWEARTGIFAHKGTPYYFWAVTVLLFRDIERGFLLMHRALQEDERTTRQQVPDTPASAFVTLNHAKQNQFFRDHVVKMATYLQDLLLTYRNKPSRNLTLADLQGRLLSNPNLRPTAFYFVYLLHKLHEFQERRREDLAQSDFAGLLELDLLFGYCLVADQVIKHKHSNPKAMFNELAAFLCLKAGLSLDKPKLDRINGKFKSHFGNALQQVLGGSICGFTLKPEEIDISLSYAIRNRGAHHLTGHQFLYRNFDDIAQRILNTLFLSVEVLY